VPLAQVLPVRPQTTTMLPLAQPVVEPTVTVMGEAALVQAVIALIMLLVGAAEGIRRTFQVLVLIAVPLPKASRILVCLRCAMRGLL